MCTFYLAFCKKGMFGVKNVCSPRPAPTIQSSLLHSTKPKGSFQRKDRKPGSRSFVTGTGRWWLIRKWSNPQGNTKKKPQEPKSKTIPERDGFPPELDSDRNFTSEAGACHCKQSHCVKVSCARAACDGPAHLWAELVT